MVGRENCLIPYNEAEKPWQGSVCWNLLKKVRHMCWWRSGTDQCLILPPCCHSAESEMSGLSQYNTVSFPCGKGKVPALKLHQYSCTSWGTGGTGCHTKWLDGYMSDIFLISLLREYLSTAPVQHLSRKNSYTEFPAPPPPTDINLDLHNRCARLQMLLWKAVAPYVSQIRSNSRHRQLWLADCRTFASDELYFLSFLVSSVLDIVGSLRDRLVSCSASDRQGSNLESCVWKAASFYSSNHSPGAFCGPV